jgi:hypothetical protein
MGAGAERSSTMRLVIDASTGPYMLSAFVEESTDRRKDA